MSSTITYGIEISVKTSYYSAQSQPRQNSYFFVYEITITNHSEFTVKLMRRKWDIVDALGKKQQVSGDGVVGETPVLEPGESFTYNSGCDFETEIGKMSGYYTMKKMVDETEFKVIIPEFIMVLPAKLN